MGIFMVMICTILYISPLEFFVNKQVKLNFYRRRKYFLYARNYKVNIWNTKTKFKISLYQRQRSHSILNISTFLYTFMTYNLSIKCTFYNRNVFLMLRVIMIYNVIMQNYDFNLLKQT